MKNLLIALITFLLLTTSCMTHRHTIGDGPVGNKGKTEIYSRAKQGYLFWGLMPLGRPNPVTPTDGNYQIKTGFNIGDTVLGVITFGIVSFRTVRIIIHKEKKVNNNTAREEKPAVEKEKTE